MLNRNEGYFLVEMVLSMAAILMAGSFLLPYSIHVRSQLVQSRQDADAIHILYDELMYIRQAGQGSERNLIVKDGFEYNVTVAKDGNDLPREVCVHYEGDHQKDSKKCAYAE